MYICWRSDNRLIDTGGKI